MIIYVILSLTVLVLIGISPIYGELPQLAGIMPEGTCEHIGGATVKIEVDSANVHETELCQLRDKYFRFYVPETCYDEEGQWTDPETGKVYIFGSTCSEPAFCNAGGTQGIYDGEYGYLDSSQKVPVIFGDKRFDIVVKSEGKILCNSLQFIQEEKKIRIGSAGQDDNNSIVVTIPKILLDGEFDVLVDETPTDVDIQETETASIITIDLGFSLSENELSPGLDRIDIIGTSVIPEFPNVGLIFFITIFSTVLVSMFSKRISFIRNPN